MLNAKPSVVVVLGVLAMEDAASAAPQEAPPIPAQLRPWAAWVLDSEEGKNARCPSHAGESSPVCAWPARLALGLGERGGVFKQEWTIFREGFVALPGNKDHWPRDIKVDGRRVPTIDHDGEPRVLLPHGRHAISGGFLWDSLPESLMVPSGTGLVSLLVKGKPVVFPMRENDGRLFLGKKVEEKAEEEKVDVSVYRKLGDFAPLLLTTRLTLAVSGKSRELLLSRALPDGFAPRAVESKLPLRFESDGRVRVQARPGVWNIEILGHKTTAQNLITRPITDGLWKEGDEIWAFEAVPDLRAVTVEGAPAIDPAQTLMPAEWKHLPAYALAPGKGLTLVEQRRGDAEPPPERLALERTLWLDGNGAGLSVHDTIAGEFTRAWRLEVAEGTRLGRLAIDNQDQFITRMAPANRDGVELRSGRARIDADSRIENSGLALPATSFAHDFDSLSTTLNMPVGWDLLHASGADKVAGSWVERWTLGQLLLLLVLVLAIGRLYGWRMGALSLLALGITLVDPRAPGFAWLLVLAGEVLVRAVKTEKLLTAARVARAATWAVLVLATIPFATQDLRFAIHPASAVDRVAPSWFANLFGRRVAQQLGFDLLQTEGRFVPFMIKAPEEAPEFLKRNGIGGLGLRHKGEEGKMGKRQAEALARNAGILGVLNAEERQAPKEGLYGLRGPAAPPPRKAIEYDPSIVIQTGEGLPRQSWRSAMLAWNGPVKSDQQIRLYLMPPWLGRLLAVAQVGLLALLALLLLRRPLRLRGSFIASRPLLAGLATLALLVPLSARAQEYPPKEILDSLKERLLQQPDCAPDCVAIGDMELDVLPARLHIKLRVSAAAPTAIALPGDGSSWSPTDLRIDGKPATAIERSSDGQLWLALPAGIFAVDLAGPLPNRDSITIPLPMRPRRATFKARGFELSGIHEDGLVDESISLSRIASTASAKRDLTEGAPTLPPFMRVERTLKLGLKWEVETRVTRETSPAAPLVVEIPLLPGESVTTADIRTEKTREAVSLSFAPGETDKTWSSTLAETRTITLIADAKTTSRWSEVWRVEVSPIWHATFSGIPPVRREPGSPSRTPEWRPWPGEQVRIAVDKPTGAPGRTLTIDASTFSVEAGLRSAAMTLDLELRASRSSDHRIALPAGAEITAIARGNAPQPIRQEGQELILSIPPGKHNVTVNWRQPTGLSTLFRVPAVDLRTPSTNSTINVALSGNPRWVLWLGGPFMGPVVGLWAVVVFILLAAFVLGRSRLTPLRTRDFLLLGLGLTQVDVLAALLIVACLLGLAWRARKPPNDARPRLYNLGQATLAILLLASVGILASVIETGLSRSPDMLLTGNQLGGNQLSWLTDRTGPMLAQPYVVSLPLWPYRVAVIAWTLWLAIAAIRWSPWVWACLKQHGLWRVAGKTGTVPPTGDNHDAAPPWSSQ